MDVASDPQLLCVSPRNFSQQLEVIRAVLCPTPLRDLVWGTQEGTNRSQAVAITFDDGYADNLHYAKPLLEKADVPATVYVSTGNAGTDREFWWDELERLLLQPGLLPEALTLKVNGNERRWELGDAADYPHAAYLANRGWNVLDPKDPTARQATYRALCAWLRPLPPNAQADVLEQLTDQASAEKEGRPSHRQLTPDEVASLGAGGFVEVGAHTVSHPILSSLPPERQWAEVQGAKVQLENWLGRPVESFAYPYGSRSDYDAQSIKAVRTAGFRHACSNFPGPVETGTDPFEIPRYIARNWDGDEFERRLRVWSDA
jgi:peptidoglycan/xylan/chitin deacetylase (PgdA/CDA1 family)